jgi:outer membrane lipoprotein-sorting protein
MAPFPLRVVFRWFHVLLAALALGLAPALHGEDSLIAKARSFIGPDAVLDGVQTLRMLGKLEVVDATDETPGTAELEILFQKPDRQRITATSENRTEITALDGYDAWSRVSDAKDSTQWQVTLLGPDQIKRLRANTFENLSFYRSLESRGARIEDRGPATVDGIACRKFAFIHARDIVFTRSFDVATGRLVLTETDSGTQIREEGELRSGGLRFPKRIVTVNTLPDGTTRTIRVEFTEISVNPEISADVFAVPALTN